MKPGWKKQEEREEKKERRRPTIKEEKMIARIVEEKENEEEDLIELRVTKEMVPRWFHKYLKVFEKKNSERMPMRKAWNHAIDLKEGFVPKKGKIYPLSRVEREEVQEFVKDQLRKRYIRPLKSPQTSLVLFVPKKDGKKRMVQDYWYLNSWMVKNNYLLPLILDLIDSIGKKKVFTKMDLWWGYNNMRIKEGDEWKAAFSTPKGSFEPTVMFFGLTNSLAMFQAMMNDLLRDLVVEEKVAVFINDVMVAIETEEGHDEIVEKVLRRLEENNLFVKPEKCVWKVRKVGFLGVIIGEDGARMEKEKVQGVVEWPVLKGVKDVQKFLGLANYYRQFVKDFAKIAKPLHKITRKETKWSWGEKQQKKFEGLKERFVMELVLVIPDLDKEMRVEANMSDFAMGGVLSMKCEDERWRPVAYISKWLNEAKRNYKIYDKEMLAIIWCLEAWRHFLEGAKDQFEIWTDHKNLEYFMKAQKLNRRQTRWLLYLSRFDFALKHVAGKSMGRADSLSRRVDWAEGVERDNENQVMLKEEWLEVRAIEQLVEEPEQEIVRKIKEARDKNEEVIKAVEEMKKAGVKMLRNEEWQIEEGLVLKERRVYVLKNEKLRVEIIWLHHNMPIAGYGGQWKTVELVTRNYWWPGVTKEVKRYVEGCDQCQRMKNRAEMPVGKLKLNQVPERPWQHISMILL